MADEGLDPVKAGESLLLAQVKPLRESLRDTMVDATVADVYKMFWFVER